MAVNMSIEYNLKIASFYEDGNLLYQGVTKTKFLGDQWVLLNHRQEAIAAFSIKRKFLSLNARIIVDFNTAKNESVVMHHRSWRQSVSFSYHDHEYLIVYHWGNKFAFFRDDTQFGLLKKKAFSFGSQRHYYLAADEGTSTELLTISPMLSLSSPNLTAANQPISQSTTAILVRNLEKWTGTGCLKSQFKSITE